MLYLVDNPPRYINWVAPTIDILFVCGLPPPMNINWAAPTINIFHLDYPPIINILDYPPNHFL